MYGQANYGPQPPRAPAYQQHPPPAPHPPPNLQFQQGPPARPPPLNQQAPPSVPSQINQPAPHLYQHGLPPPPPLVRPGRPLQIPPLHASSASESYRHPPPLLSQVHLSNQQAQHTSNLGTQSVHHNPTIIPPSHGPAHPEMLQAPQPLGALRPPHHLQGHPSYRPPFFPPPPPPPYSGGLQGLNHIPPPPPSTTLSFSTPAAYGSSIQTVMGESPRPPPPLSSSPQPISPSPPLSTNPEFSISKVKAPSSGDEAKAINQVKDDIFMHGSSQNLEARSCSEVRSQPGEVPAINGSEMLPLPPLKPTEEKTIQRIEDLCQLIAKNGPGVEDVTRQSEHGNPEYEFLFGGDPGSETAIAYEYFLWLKNKRLLEHKFQEKQSEPPLHMDSLQQPNASLALAGCMSTEDSDMEMEDDITLLDKEQEMNQSTEAPHNIKEPDVKEQINTPKLSPDRSLVQDISSEKVTYGSLLGQSEGLVSKSALRVHNQAMDSVCDLERTVSPPADNLNPSGASVASESINSKKHPENTKGGSPIRLLQVYASDDNSENDDGLLHKDINPSSVLLSLRADVSSPSRNAGRCIETDMVSKSQHCIEKPKRRSRWQSEPNLSLKAPDCSPVSQGKVRAAGRESITSERSDGYVDSDPRKESSIKHASSHVDIQKKVALDSVAGHVNSKRGDTEKENKEKKEKPESASLKVDEFGRLVREGSSDSDSDPGYANRHEKRSERGRNQNRSRSRSRSPLDRRSRRSSWRRKERRSRSRSWSPRNRRSRSRSPTYRHAGEFSGQRLRADRGRMPPCFDFIRGRCHRGAKCRFMHNEAGQSDTSRHHRSKQKNNKTRIEANNTVVSLPEHMVNEGHIQEMKDGEVNRKREDIAMETQRSIILDHSSGLIDSGTVKCHNPREMAGAVWEEKIIQERSAEPDLPIPDNKAFLEEYHQSPSVDGFPSQCVDGAGIQNSHGDTSREDLPLLKNSTIDQPQSHISVAEDQNGDCLSHDMEDSSLSEASPKLRTLTSPKKFSNSESFSSHALPSEALPNTSSSRTLLTQPIQFPAPKEFSPLNLSAPTIPQQSLQLPPPPPLPLPHTQGGNAAHMPQFPMDYNSMPQVPSYPLQPPHVGNPQTYQAFVASQHPQYSAPPNSSWTTLPPPPPPPPPPPRVSHDSHFNTETATACVSSQFQQSHFPPRNDLGFQISVRPHPSELHSNSLLQAYPSVPRQPNMQMESSRSGSSISQFGAPSLLRDDRFTHPPIQDVNTSSSSGHGILHQQPVPSEVHPFQHRHLASSHLQYPAGDSSPSVPGKPGSMPEYPPERLDKNQSSSDTDFGLPRISAHYNPYASTFEQPLRSKFSTNAFSQDNGAVRVNEYDIPFSRPTAIDGQGVGSFGSRQATSSPGVAKAVAAGQLLSGSGGGQYDPLFDSIDPSSNARRKEHHGRNLEPVGESDPVERCGGSYKPLDLEENNRHLVAAVASTTSPDNDEFGETADAEVGSVENESPGEPVGVPTAGWLGSEENSPGKKKKKDSRSTKPFKIAIAEFVKDVLKPSWRQGNMSKEAFKTIVKKTVDKVSGAMKGHQMPKSQAKINQYIDSQQRKLTKLVMGYVDKYVKI